MLENQVMYNSRHAVADFTRTDSQTDTLFKIARASRAHLWRLLTKDRAISFAKVQKDLRVSWFCGYLARSLAPAGQPVTAAATTPVLY